MRTRDEIVAALEALGWRVAAGPTQTPYGFKATIEHDGAPSVLQTGKTETEVLEELLRYAEDDERRFS